MIQRNQRIGVSSEDLAEAHIWHPWPQKRRGRDLRCRSRQSWSHNRLFLGANRAGFACVWIESEYRDPRLHYPKVADQRSRQRSGHATYPLDR